MMLLAQGVIDFPTVRADQIIPIIIGLLLFAILTSIQSARAQNELRKTEAEAQSTINKLVLELQNRNTILGEQAFSSMQASQEASTELGALERDKARLTAERDKYRSEVADLTRRLNDAIIAKSLIASSTTREIKTETRRGLEYKKIIQDMSAHVELLEEALDHALLIIRMQKEGREIDEALLAALKSSEDIRRSVPGFSDAQSAHNNPNKGAGNQRP